MGNLVLNDVFLVICNLLVEVVHMPFFRNLQQLHSHVLYSCLCSQEQGQQCIVQMSYRISFKQPPFQYSILSSRCRSFFYIFMHHSLDSGCSRIARKRVLFGFGKKFKPIFDVSIHICFPFRFQFHMHMFL